MNRMLVNASYAPAFGELFGAGVELYARSLGRTAQLQKEILNTVADQSAASAEMWRSTLHMVPGATAWLNFLEQGMNNAVSAQRQLVGVLAEQTMEIAQTAESEGQQAIAVVRNISHVPKPEKRRRSKKAHSRSKRNHKARSQRH